MPHHAQLPLWDDKSSAQKLETLRHMVQDLYEVTLADARKKLDNLLSQAHPADEKEAQDIATMRQMLATHPNIMSSNCEVGHFTGSSLVCDNQGRVLLHFHKNLSKWLQFGGHADAETDFAQVALRETKEETGLRHLLFFPRKDSPQPIDFDIHSIPARKNRPEHLHLDIRYMLLTINPDSLNPPDGESQQLEWSTYEDLLDPDNQQVEPSLKRLIRKCQDRYLHYDQYLK